MGRIHCSILRVRIRLSRQIAASPSVIGKREMILPLRL